VALKITGSLDDNDLLFLPWSTPLEEWPEEYVVALPRGISRHVVRFTRIGDKVYAVKEISTQLAVHEYGMLRRLRKLGVPCVKSVGIVRNREDEAGNPLDSVLITRHLPFSLPYRALFSGQLRDDSVTRLVDALVLLIVRLHLIGFAWKDCSLSNTLFRRDAGDFAAYLVDAETGELHDSLSDGLRWYDIDTATTNIAGELMDLQAGGKLPDHLDPVDLALELPSRYKSLWELLNRRITVSREERHVLDRHIRQLNELGFDIGELQVEQSGSTGRVKVRAKVVDPDHHSRRLMRLTGLDVGENQARRLLNDMDAYRAAQDASGSTTARDEQVCAHRWLTEVFEPVVSAVPPDLVGKLEPAEVFHEVMEHRWFLSEKVGHDVGTEWAITSYINEVLRGKPDEQAVLGSRSGRPSDDKTVRLVLPKTLRDR
jgi:hypothetical protein